MIVVDTKVGRAVIRPATASELKLVRDSWTKGATRGDEMRAGGTKMLRLGRDRAIGRKAFAAGHRLFVDAELELAEVHVLAAEEEPDEAIGWVCWRPAPATLHWVWVRGAARRLGCGRALLEHAKASIPGGVLSHLTPEGQSLMEAVGW